MPVASLLGHVGPRPLGGVQRFFYNSTPTGAATNLPSKSRTDDPVARPIRPASHRVAGPPAFANAPAAAGSAGSCARTNVSAAGASCAPGTAGAPAGRRPRKNLKIRRSPACSGLVRRAAGSAHAPAGKWLSCPPACHILPRRSSYIIYGNALMRAPALLPIFTSLNSTRHLR